MRTELITTAFILGAGLGTRLLPLTKKIPKPLLPIGGRPIITYTMEHLRTIGVQRFIINTHHRADKYSEAFPNNDWRGTPIIFRHEPMLLDTAGGIKNIEDLITKEDRIIIYNGDIITNMPIAPLIDQHFALKSTVTLALRSNGPLLNVNINQNGFICDMRHILKNPGIQSYLFAGIYIIETKFLQQLEAGRVESLVPPLVEMIKENPRSVGGSVTDDGCWYDLGSLKEYEKINKLFQDNPQLWNLPKTK